MKAAVIDERGAPPKFGDFHEPEPCDGAVLIDVDTAGLGGWDVLGAYRLGVTYPCVIRGEGVGHADGRRVYFGERAVQPYGAWAERTLVPADEVWDVPDDIDDRTAITMGIAATGAIVPLEQARIQPGDRVLILGATGTLGQIALQLARHLGAGRVVGAARSEGALAKLQAKGIADGVVQLSGSDDDDARLKDASDGGFDVVLDLVCGPPMLAALKATRWGARIMTIGTGAGRQIHLDMADLLFRTLSCIGTGQRPPADRRAIWERLLAIHRAQPIVVDHESYTLDRAADAWAAQAASPHAKITASVRTSSA